MEITIKLVAPELAEAIQALAAALAGPVKALSPVKSETEPVITSNSAPAQTPEVGGATTPLPEQTQAFIPSSVVPTTAPTYTMEQLAVAATQLVDAGRRTELVALLASFGVQALTALPKEHYGAFATKLRTMGAKI